MAIRKKSLFHALYTQASLEQQQQPPIHHFQKKPPQTKGTGEDVNR